MDRRRLVPLLLVLLHGASGGTSAAPAQDSGPDQGVGPTCHLVEIARGADLDRTATRAAEMTGGVVVRRYATLVHGFAICLPPGADPSALSADPAVLRVERDTGVSAPAPAGRGQTDSPSGQ